MQRFVKLIGVHTCLHVCMDVSSGHAFVRVRLCWTLGYSHYRSNNTDSQDSILFMCRIERSM